MSYIKSKVVMLPINGIRENTSPIIKDNIDNKLLTDRPTYYCKNWNFCNLYFLSDGEIEEDDWYYNTRLKEIFKAKNFIKSLKTIVEFKIIASTDINLGFAPFGGQDIYTLPQPSKKFVNLFIERYNAGDVIEEVEIEYDLHEEPVQDGNYSKYEETSIKTNKNNIINIKLIKVKKSWNRKEVERLCNDAYHAGHDDGQRPAEGPIGSLLWERLQGINDNCSSDNWITKNL